MAAYELVTGQRVWELNLAGISTPAVAGEWIFTLTDEAKLLCIAKTTGKVRWKVPDFRDFEGILSGAINSGQLRIINTAAGIMLQATSP
jgi:outer membrane protein assembly factor BamB